MVWLNKEVYCFFWQIKGTRGAVEKANNHKKQQEKPKANSDDEIESIFSDEDNYVTATDQLFEQFKEVDEIVRIQYNDKVELPVVTAKKDQEQTTGKIKGLNRQKVKRSKQLVTEESEEESPYVKEA